MRSLKKIRNLDQGEEKMKKIIGILVVGISLLLIGMLGCGGMGMQDQKSGQGGQTGTGKQWEEVKGKILTEGYPAEISSYLEANKTKETQQAFNINNKTYLVLTMGQRPSAGYHIELTKLGITDGKLIVQAEYVKPKPDELVATVITYPSLVIETDDIYEGHYSIEFVIDK